MGHEMKLTEGQQVALRRDALGWKQPDLASAVGVSLSTISRVEGDDPRVSRAMRAAVIAALEKEERKRGLTGPSLSTPPSTTASSTEGADVSQLLEARRSLARAEVFLVGALEEVRRGLAVLTEDAIERFRKSG